MTVQRPCSGLTCQCLQPGLAQLHHSGMEISRQRWTVVPFTAAAALAPTHTTRTCVPGLPTHPQHVPTAAPRSAFLSIRVVGAWLLGHGSVAGCAHQGATLAVGHWPGTELHRTLSRPALHPCCVTDASPVCLGCYRARCLAAYSSTLPMCTCHASPSLPGILIWALSWSLRTPAASLSYHGCESPPTCIPSCARVCARRAET